MEPQNKQTHFDSKPAFTGAGILSLTFFFGGAATPPALAANNNIDTQSSQKHIEDRHIGRSPKDLRVRCKTDASVGPYATSFHSASDVQKNLPQALSKLPSGKITKKVEVSIRKANVGYGIKCSGRNKGAKVKCNTIKYAFGPAAANSNHNGKLATAFPSSCVVTKKKRKKGFKLKTPGLPLFVPKPLLDSILPPTHGEYPTEALLDTDALPSVTLPEAA